MAQKTLYRSTTDKKVGGLIAGLADYFDVEVSILRLITVALIVMSGIIPGVLVYLLALPFVPIAPEKKEK